MFYYPLRVIQPIICRYRRGYMTRTLNPLQIGIDNRRGFHLNNKNLYESAKIYGRGFLNHALFLYDSSEEFFKSTCSSTIHQRILYQLDNPLRKHSHHQHSQHQHSNSATLPGQVQYLKSAQIKMHSSVFHRNASILFC